MAFDADGFLRAPLQARTQDVDVPELAEWFGEDKPIWRVRGLSANEIQRSADAKIRLNRESALVDALSSGSRADMAEELARVLGRKADDVEPEVGRRMELLIAGSVEPVCNLELAGKLADSFPIPFINITNAILSLTGQGAEAKKKPTASGKTPASKAP